MITKLRVSSSLPGQWMKDQLYLASLGHMLALRAGWGLAGRPGRVEGAGTEVWKGPRYEPSMHWPLPVLLGSVHQPQPGWSRHWPHVLYPEQFSAADGTQNKQCRIFITVTYGIIIVDVESQRFLSLEIFPGVVKAERLSDKRWGQQTRIKPNWSTEPSAWEEILIFWDIRLCLVLFKS